MQVIHYWRNCESDILLIAAASHKKWMTFTQCWERRGKSDLDQVKRSIKTGKNTTKNPARNWWKQVCISSKSLPAMGPQPRVWATRWVLDGHDPSHGSSVTLRPNHRSSAAALHICHQVHSHKFHLTFVELRSVQVRPDSGMAPAVRVVVSKSNPGFYVFENSSISKIIFAGVFE